MVQGAAGARSSGLVETRHHADGRRCGSGAATVLLEQAIHRKRPRTGHQQQSDEQEDEGGRALKLVRVGEEGEKGCAVRRQVRDQQTTAPGSLKDASFQPCDVELGRIGDRHHRHHAGLHRIGNHQVAGLRNASSHVQADDQQPL